MANRLQQEDRQALMQIRENLINDYNIHINMLAQPATAMMKQADAAQVIARAIKGLEEVLTAAGGVEFKK